MDLIVRNPMFRLLWLNGMFSQIGFMGFGMVHGWLALEVTDSPFWVGAAAGAMGLGLISFGAVAGLLVDRLDRRAVVLAATVLQAAGTGALIFLVFTDDVRLWHIMGSAYLLGVVSAARTPARMALMLDVVGRGFLLKATAADFASMSMMAIVTPLVAGSVVSGFGLGWAYLSIASAEVVGSLFLIGLVVERKSRRRPQTPWKDLVEGMEYVFTAPIVRTLMLMVLITEAFGWSHETIMPVMAGIELDVGASGFGYLMSAGGSGAFVSALVLSSVGEVEDKGRLVVMGLGGFGLFLVLFAFSPWFQLSLVLLALAYGMAVMYEATVHTLFQTVVPDEMRGRVLSFQAMTWGLTGASGFHMGAIASALDARIAIAIGGGVVMLNGLRLVGKVSGFREAAEAPSVDGQSTV